MAESLKMASKRNLYRPAQVQENVGQRKPRKTLAQGRLISSNSAPQKVQTNAVLSSPSHVSNTSGNVSRLHTSLIQGQLEESIFSPRRSVPQASEPKSPQHGPPADSLDLTDSDDYPELPNERQKYQLPSEILCIDASRQTVDADVSEVDIRIGFEKKTPVKIICHSPARMNNSYRLTPDETENLIQDQQFNRFSPQVGKTRAVIKEKLSGNSSELRTAVQSIPMSPSLGSRRILQSLPSNLPQPNFDDTSDSDVQSVNSSVMDKVTDRDDDNMSVISDIVSEEKDSNNIKGVKITNHKKHEMAKTTRNQTTKSKASGPTRKVAVGSTRKEPPKRPDTEKKKKGTVIASRYMQSAETKAKMSLSSKMEKSTLEKSGNRSSKSLVVPTLARKPVRKTVRSADMDRPQTPENQSIASSLGAKTSTPTMDGTLFSHPMDIDASAIDPEVSLLAGDRSTVGKSSSADGNRRKPMYTDEVKSQSCLSRSLMNTTNKPTQKQDLKASQQRLDLLAMNTFQWYFLEAKARKTLEDQERQAMAQIYGMHEEREKLRKVKADKEQQLAKLRHMNCTDYMTEVQRQCLGPVVNNLTVFKKQHQCLAEALDTTRHQIATRDVHLPENEDQFQARLEAHLSESERLLGEIQAVTGQDVPKVCNMADAIVTMEKAVQDMDSELKKNRELLAATETLTMHECSLRVQELQMSG